MCQRTFPGQRGIWWGDRGDGSLPPGSRVANGARRLTQMDAGIVQHFRGKPGLLLRTKRDQASRDSPQDEPTETAKEEP